MDMGREEAIESFDRLTDRAYVRHKAYLIDPELEM